MQPMADRARSAMQTDELAVVADRGDFNGEQIVACETAGILVHVPKPQTSNRQARCRFGTRDFIYEPDSDTYRCPAGPTLIWRFSTVGKGQTLHCYWSSACKGCSLKTQSTSSAQRGVNYVDRLRVPQIIDNKAHCPVDVRLSVAGVPRW